MRTHDGRINHLQCRVGQAAAGERLQHHIPDATVSPAAELPKNRIPVAELLRQIPPRRAGPHQPKRRVHHTAMVARRTASATDQKRFEIRPLIIGQQSANQGCPPQRAALNQFSIPASIDLSTRPSPARACDQCGKARIAVGAERCGRPDMDPRNGEQPPHAHRGLAGKKRPLHQDPDDDGTGSALIEKAIPAATVKREFRPEGLICTIEVPLPEMTENDAAGVRITTRH